MHLRAVALLSLALAASGCEPRGLGARHEELRVCADGATVDGIDVSHWQGTIDWDAVAGDGIAFAFVRVSDGLTYPDAEFARNWSEARRVGIVRGVYQFFRPGQDPIAQADLLVDMMGPLEAGDLPPVLDAEATDGESIASVQAGVQAWIDRVEERTGRRPIVYTGLYFWRDSVGSLDVLPSPLWVAQYGPVCPDIPGPWTRWDFFQTSSTGSVSGIAGNVDTDLFNGSLEALQAFAGGASSCGDLYCSVDETHDLCPGDCPICEPIPPEGRLVEESELCFEPTGPPSGWRTVTGEGSGGSLIWTHTIDTASENVAYWYFDFVEAGRYRLEVFTPAPHNQSTMAPYAVRHAGADDRIALDQSAVDGWQTLGDFDFAMGEDQWLRIEDGSGEPLSTLTEEVLDAVRLTRLDRPDAGPTVDGGLPDAGRIDAAPRDAAGGDGGPRAPLSSGCGCRTGRRPPPTLPLLLLAGLVVRRGRAADRGAPRRPGPRRRAA